LKVEPNHSKVKCIGNKLRENLELIEDFEKLEEDEHENILRRKLETLKVKYFCRRVINLKHLKLICLILEFTR